MSITIQINQQRATVDYLRMFVKTGRAKVADLEKEERRLDELLQLQNPTIAPTVQKVENTEPVILLPPQNLLKEEHIPLESPGVATAAFMIMPLKAELMNQADYLTKKQAELSNRLRDIPKKTTCPELMNEIIQLRAEIENTWTKYRYLERNGQLPPEDTEETKQKSIELLESINKRAALAQKQSKLRKKLKDPVASRKASKREEWSDALNMVSLEIDHLDEKIKVLKDQ